MWVQGRCWRVRTLAVDYHCFLAHSDSLQTKSWPIQQLHFDSKNGSDGLR